MPDRVRGSIGLGVVCWVSFEVLGDRFIQEGFNIFVVLEGNLHQLGEGVGVGFSGEGDFEHGFGGCEGAIIDRFTASMLSHRNKFSAKLRKRGLSVL